MSANTFVTKCSKCHQKATAPISCNMGKDYLCKECHEEWLKVWEESGLKEISEHLEAIYGGKNTQYEIAYKPYWLEVFTNWLGGKRILKEKVVFI